MLSIGENTPVYLACGATDMRKSINGLCSIVENSFNLNPFGKGFHADNFKSAVAAVIKSHTAD